MLPKQTRKEIKIVLKKYNGQENRLLWKAHGIFAVMATGFGLGVDMIRRAVPENAPALTGTEAWMGTLVGAATGLTWAALRTPAENIAASASTWNTAGQEIVTKTVSVQRALNNMERKLKTSFAKASDPKATLQEKLDFAALAREVEEDAKILSPKFRIISGGKNGFGEGKLEFVVAERFPAPGLKEFVTLGRAVGEVAPKKQALVL